MNKVFALVLLPISLVLLSYCTQLEQADPFRTLRMSVRLYAPLNHPGTTVEMCNDFASNFIFVATPGPDNPAENIATQPTNNVPFSEVLSVDDSVTPQPPVQILPPGCLMGRNIALTTGQWILSVSRTTDAGNVIWNTSCEVLITTDESTTNSPWAGFSANGEEFDTVGTTEGCIFEDVELVSNVYP